MPLINIVIESVYRQGGNRIPLPKRMAQCTPDMKAAMDPIDADLRAKQGKLILSDLFRSYDMQLQSYLDWKNGKKKAYSPPPGGSMHEAGRALDLDLGSLGMTLANFWPIAKQNGLTAIIATPDSGKNEAWHFDCRGSHDKVYRYYTDGKATNMKPYQAMAASAILSVGVKVDRFENQEAALTQSALIRLGFDPGNIDGGIGQRTRDALQQAGVPVGDTKTMLSVLQLKLQQEFPGEYVSANGFEDNAPEHIST